MRLPETRIAAALEGISVSSEMPVAH